MVNAHDCSGVAMRVVVGVVVGVVVADVLRACLICFLLLMMID